MVHGATQMRASQTCRISVASETNGGATGHLDATPGTEVWVLKRPQPADGQGRVLDPTIPEVRERIRNDVAGLAAWGYQLVKHDFSTYDLFGRWGYRMDAALTDDGWAFNDRSRTTAEVVRDVYQAIRDGAGEHTIVIGCNTIGHLGAGLFELQRTGDDTSGKEWNRTRRRGREHTCLSQCAACELLCC